MPNVQDIQYQRMLEREAYARRPSDLKKLQESRYTIDVFLRSFRWSDENKTAGFVEALISKINETFDEVKKRHSHPNSDPLVLSIAEAFNRNPQFRSATARSLLITEGVRQLFVKIFCNDIFLLIIDWTNDNRSAQEIFFTSETVSAVYKTFVSSPCAFGAASVITLLQAIVGFDPQFQSLLCTMPAVSHTISLLKTTLRTGYNRDESTSVQSLGLLIGNTTANNPNARSLFSNSEAASTIVAVFCKHAKTSEIIDGLGFAIQNIAEENDAGQNHFIQADLAPAITNALASFAKASMSVQRLCLVIGSITAKNKEAQDVFSSNQSFAALILALKYVNTAEGVNAIFFCLQNLLCKNPPGVNLFSCAPFVEALKSLEQFATSDESKKNFAACLKLLTPSSGRNSSVQTNSSASASASYPKSNGASSTHAPPRVRCFQRGVPELSLEDSMRAALSLRELPRETLADGSVKILRPDLQDYIPTDDDVTLLLQAMDRQIGHVLGRTVVQNIMKNHNLTEDDIRVLVLFKFEDPYPFYLWMNAWLMGGRRDERIKNSVGPIFTRLYRAIEKLPKIKCRASRSVKVRNIPALRDTFDNYQDRCASGNLMSFWGFASFSRDDVIGGGRFAGTPSEEVITYSCENLEGVDMEPFRPEGIETEHEILPLCPAVFKVVGATKSMFTKLIVQMEQLDHKQHAYVNPK